MRVEDIADYCEFKDCSVAVGDPEAGFIHIDGTGLRRPVYNYGRFMLFGELSGLPLPAEVVKKASVFKVARGDTTQTLDRSQFEAELALFRRQTL